MAKHRTESTIGIENKLNLDNDKQTAGNIDGSSNFNNESMDLMKPVLVKAYVEQSPSLLKMR